jgi:GNAT superfamily N-acetyltransferase
MKQAYKDIVNEEFLQEINSESEIQKMHDVHIKRIDDENDKSFILYVDDNPAGIFRVGSSRRDKYKDYGEFRAIYLLDEYKKKGYGKIMFQSGIKELIDMGYDKMILDCLKLNPTNNFYKHFGGKIIDTATVKMGEQELEENIYLYDNLKFMISF